MRGVVMRGVGKRMLISETGEVLRLMHNTQHTWSPQRNVLHNDKR